MLIGIMLMFLSIFLQFPWFRPRLVRAHYAADGIPVIGNLQTKIELYQLEHDYLPGIPIDTDTGKPIANSSGFDAARAERVCLDWFDNYRFGSADAPPVANTTLVLNLFNQVVNGGGWPANYIDENLRTDYAKIKHLVTLGRRLDASDRRLNGNFGVLETLVAGGALSEPLVKSFQAKQLTRKENFTSLLYWLGLTTITGGKFGKTTFGIPNETLRKLAADMIPAAYSDIHDIDCVLAEEV